MQVNRFATPGYREAVKRENDVRDAAFLELTTSICGIEIRQMDARDFLILDGIGSPLLTGSDPTIHDVAHFFWVLSPNPGAFRAKHRIGQRCRKLDIWAAIVAIDTYLDGTFQDAPAKRTAGHAPFAGWCAYIIDALSSEYGWTRDEVMSCPLKIVYQQIKCIKKRLDSNAAIRNPSDSIIDQHIELKQQRLNLVKLLAKRARNN